MSNNEIQGQTSFETIIQVGYESVHFIKFITCSLLPQKWLRAPNNI